MNIWGLNNFYSQSLYPQWSGAGSYAFLPTFSSIPSSIFSFGTPRYDVFNSNILGYTPPTNFSYLPQLNNPFNFMGQLSFNSLFTTPQLFNTQLFTPSLPTYSSGTSSACGNLLSFLNSSRTSSSSSSSSSTSSYSSGQRSYNTDTNLPTLRAVGYNTEKAQRLAKAIGKEAKEGGFDGRCAAHVKTAIQNAGLGDYVSGHAYQMDTILEKNPNFKQISAEGVDLKKLPAGCILVYERGVSRYSSQYGHVEITFGNGTAGSGGITHNLRAGAKIFVPV